MSGLDGAALSLCAPEVRNEESRARRVDVKLWPRTLGRARSDYVVESQQNDGREYDGQDEHEQEHSARGYATARDATP